jgi:chromate transporter
MIDARAPMIPHQSYAAVFLRFLKFGLLAWGGPVAQIAMIRRELVEEEKWISPERFNRALAVYQVLPGPEAHELCVYFGMLARGRLGAILAGLGFMLPGFLLMFALSWVYLAFGIRSPLVAAAFAAVQAAVIALIVRAVHRIGRGALTDRWLWIIAGLSATAQFFGVHFGITLLFAGFAYVFCVRGRYALAAAVTLVCAVAAMAYVVHFDPTRAVGAPAPVALRTPGSFDLFLSGLKAGLLTFGGAYTVIPFLRRDAVVTGAWMTDAQFLDGLALSGTLPAPLIIFATFVGYVGGGPLGAILVTAGIFLPAFGFTLIGHDLFERITRNDRVHKFLDGVTAGVVGLIATAAIVLFKEGIRSAAAVGVFAAAIITLHLWHSKWAVLAVALGTASVGLLMDVR